MPEKRARRTYSEEQKKQLVELFNHGKPRSEIIREYDLTASGFDKWAKRINATACVQGAGENCA
jgi:transposase